jgi:hypothetical protein
MYDWLSSEFAGRTRRDVGPAQRKNFLTSPGRIFQKEYPEDGYTGGINLSLSYKESDQLRFPLSSPLLSFLSMILRFKLRLKLFQHDPHALWILSGSTRHIDATRIRVSGWVWTNPGYRILGKTDLWILDAKILCVQNHLREPDCRRLRLPE